MGTFFVSDHTTGGMMDTLKNQEAMMLEPLSDAFLILFEAWFLNRKLSADEQRQVARAWALVQSRKTLVDLIGERLANEND